MSQQEYNDTLSLIKEGDMQGISVIDVLVKIDA
jgi:hypothetical protein